MKASRGKILPPPPPCGRPQLGMDKPITFPRHHPLFIPHYFFEKVKFIHRNHSPKISLTKQKNSILLCSNWVANKLTNRPYYNKTIKKHSCQWSHCSSVVSVCSQRSGFKSRLVRCLKFKLKIEFSRIIQACSTLASTVNLQ